MKHLYAALLCALPFLGSAQISVIVVNDSASCQFPCNGYVEVAVTGGAPPYNFVMTPSAHTNNAGICTNICAGTDTITILDATVGSGAISVSPNDTVCSGDDQLSATLGRSCFSVVSGIRFR